MDELKTKIDLKPLTEQEIQEHQFDDQSLWMVRKGNDEPIGPFDTKTLKEYAHTYEFLFEDGVDVQNLADETWKEVFSLSQFQRRKPQLVSAHNLGADQTFFFLSHGQKEGPFEEQEMQSFLDKGEITPSTQISLDSGKSWIKLYEFHAFDRRSKKSNQELPFRPEQNILEQINAKKDDLKGRAPDDALLELAFMGGHKNESPLELDIQPPKTKTSHYKVSAPVKFTPTPASNNDSSKFKYAIASSLALVLVVSFAFFSGDSFTPDVNGEVKTVTKGINNSTRNLQKREPASVKPQNKPAPRRMVKKRLAPTSFKRPTRKRVVRKEAHNEERGFERNIENIDINDPEVQEELTRQLAGDYEEEENLDGDRDEEEQENDDRSDEYPENEEQRFEEEERIEHQYE